MQGVGDSQGGFLKRIAAQFASLQRSVTVINKGIGGQSTPAMLARMDELASLRPYDLVVILGCNDLPRARDEHPDNRTSLEVYSANLRHLLPAIQGRRSLFISSFAVSAERTGIASEVFDSYMNAVTAIAQAAGYDLWDLYNETKHTTAPLLAADGLHFNDDGHALIARHVHAWLTASEGVH